jgi:hypothetical protein
MKTEKETLKLLVGKLIREQMEEIPRDAYFSAREKKPFSSDLIEKIVKDEITSGHITDQPSLESFFAALEQSITELKAIPFDIFINSQQLKPA